MDALTITQIDTLVRDGAYLPVCMIGAGYLYGLMKGKPCIVELKL